MQLWNCGRVVRTCDLCTDLTSTTLCISCNDCKKIRILDGSVPRSICAKTNLWRCANEATVRMFATICSLAGWAATESGDPADPPASRWSCWVIFASRQFVWFAPCFGLPLYVLQVGNKGTMRVTIRPVFEPRLSI